MNSKFFDLRKEKQDRMINAALKVFALQGFKHASTDDIVREAAISKGLLFHYFENKAGVYDFVYDYSVRYLLLEMSSAEEPRKNDLFDVKKQLELAHMRAMKCYPYMKLFLDRAMSEPLDEASEETAGKRQEVLDAYEKFYSRIDYSQVPEGVDGHMLLKTVDLTCRGLMTEHFAREQFDPRALYDEITAYLEMLKKAVYHS